MTRLLLLMDLVPIVGLFAFIVMPWGYCGLVKGWYGVVRATVQCFKETLCVCKELVFFFSFLSSFLFSCVDLWQVLEVLFCGSGLW